MAESLLTAANLLTINDRNAADTDVPDFLDRSPAITNLSAVVASNDTVHKYFRYALPSTGFRAINNGREVQTSTDTAVTVNLAILDASFRVDMEAANEYRTGAEAWLNREAARALRSAFFSAEKQIFQGTGNDANGFNGFPDDASLDGSADSFIVDAGGSTNLTSIYVVRSGDEDVQVITGKGGDISMGTPTVQETAGSSTGTYPALYTPVSGWLGLKIGSNHASATRPSVVRICNVDHTASTELDNEIYDAIKLFDDEPTHIFASPKALERMRRARTTYNPVGTPATTPDNIEGIPIFATRGISDSETAVS